MAKLNDDAGVTSGNVPSPPSDWKLSCILWIPDKVRFYRSSYQYDQVAKLLERSSFHVEVHENEILSFLSPEDDGRLALLPRSDLPSNVISGDSSKPSCESKVKQTKGHLIMVFISWIELSNMV
ncbi:unnamed protein product [Protopolystoma xenopodis]|uniref:Uncharacterized protein n=1 Tax=Protopolystoma xenopodis TaxID=117903 RepID=A0A448WRP9_9PLAT|nr:unnamed protein product [Protopolystoma xenopodis]